MPRRDNPEPDLDLGLLTDRLTTSLQRALRGGLGAEGECLGPRHRAVMAYLGATGSRATELARRCGQHKQVIGTLVDDLERRGYVRREPDPTDRRAKRIVPTRLGQQHRSATAEVMTRIEQTLAQDLGERRYDEFKQAFQQVTRLLSTAT